MIHNAKVEVTCDGNKCKESIQLEPNYMYSNYSGGGGRYDTSDSALETLISDEGWTIDGGEHLCPECAGGGDE